jgi:hypothetical protein
MINIAVKPVAVDRVQLSRLITADADRVLTPSPEAPDTLSIVARAPDAVRA